MTMEETFDNLQTVMRTIYVELVTDGLGGMLGQEGEFLVTRTNRADPDPGCGYEASTIVSTAGGLLIELVAPFADLAERWPAQQVVMAETFVGAVRAIAEQAEAIEDRAAALRLAAEQAIHRAQLQGARISLVSVAHNRVHLSAPLKREDQVDVAFVVTTTMLDSGSRLDIHRILVRDAEEFGSHFERHVLPGQLRRAGGSGRRMAERAYG